MILLTKEIRQSLPPLYATEDDPDPMVFCRFFHPLSTWEWFITEFDGEDLMFGLVSGLELEWGYISLEEISSFRDNSFGLPLERDFYFSPQPTSQVKANLRNPDHQS